jgi:hypothetical protein
VGAQLGSLVRALGHEPADDQDESNGTAWWNEVVGRIEDCEVFLALVSPAYADAHSCRLAVKHAAATGLPVVRLDIGDETPTVGLHPIVKMARPARFDPDDPDASAVLNEALDEALFPDEPPASQPEAVLPTPQAAPPPPPPEVPPPAPPAAPPPKTDAALRRMRGPELAIVLAMVLSALALQYLLLNMLRGSEPAKEASPDQAGVAASAQSASAQSTSGQPSSDAEPSQPAASEAGSPGGSPAAQLLSLISAADAEGMPGSSCATSDGQVTCRNPDANVQVAVLTPHSSPEKLYDAYRDAVRELSGDPMPENTGDCSGSAFEGELSWDLDRGHGFDVSIDDQAAGGLDPATEAAGRIFCTESSDIINLVWTQDSGVLVTATGQPAKLIIGWWHDVHVELACAAGQQGSGCS